MEGTAGSSYRDFDIKTLDTIKGAKCTDTSIGSILTTNIGTVPGFPEFSAASDLLFNNLTPAAIEAYSNIVRSMISKFEPRVVFKTLLVEKHPYDANTLIVTVDYFLKDESETRKVAVNLTNN